MMILASVYGRLTKEPEMRTTNNGTQVAGFSIAVNHGKDGQGNYVTAFVDISALGKTAETVMKYLRKGFRVCVFADLRLRRYTTQQGVQGSTLEGTAIRVELVDSPEQQQPAHSLQRRRRRAVMRPIPVCPRPAPAPTAYPNYAPPAAPPTPGAYPPPPTGGWTPPGTQENMFPYGANARH